MSMGIWSVYHCIWSMKVMRISLLAWREAQKENCTTLWQAHSSALECAQCRKQSHLSTLNLLLSFPYAPIH